MTCRHSKGDPNCSSSAYYQAQVDSSKIASLQKKVEDLQRASDNTRFEIEDVFEGGEGSHIILKVKYPNCGKCSFEGTKVLVYENVKLIDILKWKEIDPHFVEKTTKRSQKQAPGPIARFPADSWNKAIEYVKFLDSK